jgi:hypothetical protein
MRHRYLLDACMRRHLFNWCATIIHCTNIVYPFPDCLQVQLQRVRFAFVVPLEQQDHDIKEVDEAGPQFVVSLSQL